MVALRTLLVLLFLVSLPGPAASQDCVSGTVAVQETSPGSGVWEYCVSLTWDVTALGKNPSHFSLILAVLTNCPCVCDEGMFTFGTPAGTSTGEDAAGLPCAVDYQGTFDCSGDPTLPQHPGPTVKWEGVTGSACEPGRTGTGTFCFLSPLPPAAPSSTTAAIKLGTTSCAGTVTGPLPDCNGCATHAIPRTWGRLKALYR